MFCTHCGQQIDDKAVFCVHCGITTQGEQSQKKVKPEEKIINGFGIAGFVTGLLSLWLGALFCIPAIFGLILGIIGTTNTKKCNSLNGLALAGLIISVVALLFWGCVWTAVVLKSLYLI